MINNLRHIEKAMYIYVVIVSIILFVAILHFIDKKNLESHKPPITMTVKGGVFILCFVATTTIFSLLSEEKIVTGDMSHLTYINQDIETGFPNF